MLEIARRTRLPSRPQLGAISSSRCQKTRAIVRSTRIGLLPDEPSRWWSQTGSNRRPPACKAGALPTELWPRSAERVQRQVGGASREVVGLGRLELPTSRLSSARSNQLSYKPKIRPRPRMRAVATRPGERPTWRAIGACRHDRAAHMARARPRRKRNGDGGVPPMDIYGLNRSALMFPRDPIATA